jgi:hypothetical protein
VTIRTHAATDEYRKGWDAIDWTGASVCAELSAPVKPSEADIARVYCRRLLPYLPASPASHVAIPLWALRALVGEP